MARIPIKCGCGWSFFISDAAPGWSIACPSCGVAVPIPGRRPGKSPESHADIAREKARQKGTFILLGLGLLGLIGVAVLLLVLGSEEAKPPRGTMKPGDSDSPGPASPGAAPPVRVKVMEDPSSAAPPPPARPKVEPEDVPRLRRAVDQMVTYANMAGIVSEVLRHQDRPEAYERLRDRMTEYEDRIQKTLVRLLDYGDQYPVPNHMVPQDRLNTFAERDLFKMSMKDAAAHIDRWLRAFQPGALTQGEVIRGADTLRITFFFPEQNDELLGLMKEAAIVPGDIPMTPMSAPPPPSSQEVVAMPQDVVQMIRQRFAALPAGYRQCLPPDERDRLDRLLATTGKVFKEDVGFLRDRIVGEVLAVFEDENQRFREKAKDLEARTQDQGSSDVVHFKDGRKIDGKVEEETEDHVKIKSRFGSVKVPRADIQKIDRGKGAASEFPDRLKSAQGKPDQMTLLMAWCKEKNLTVHKDYLGYLILTLDPLNDRARAEIKAGRPFGQAAPTGLSGAHDNETVSRKIEAIAADISARTTVFAEVLTEMKKQTDRLRYTLVVPPPDKFSQVANIIQDPIQFKPGDLKIDSAVQITQWWSALLPEERRHFAHFYGLWCAYVRYVTDARK